MQYSEKVNIAGGTIKGGANWNIDAKSNIFANAGFFSKQPNLGAVSKTMIKLLHLTMNFSMKRLLD